MGHGLPLTTTAHRGQLSSAFSRQKEESPPHGSAGVKLNNLPRENFSPVVAIMHTLGSGGGLLPFVIIRH